MTYVAVYGTLKRGQRLYEMCNLSDPQIATFIGETRFVGYDMYSNGFYPICVPGPGTVIVQVFDIHDKETLDFINRIEFGAGYICAPIVVHINKIPYTANIFIQSSLDITKYTKINSGCW